MNKISYCGLDCLNCEIYQATTIGTKEKKTEIAKKYKLNEDDINCFGCSDNQGALFKHCQDCKVRECGTSKGLSNCGECPEYPCDKLDLHFEQDYNCRVILDSIKENL